VEQSGNINPYPPFNYPRKSSLFRYSRGHQDITCQGCHESTHGLYPVTPTIDTTSYAQAASMNADGSRGPLNCSACHYTNESGVYVLEDNRVNAALTFKGTPIDQNYDAAVSFAHTFTEESDVRSNICLRCHGDNASLISATNSNWTKHAFQGKVSRASMDKAEIAQLGAVVGTTDPYNTVCKSCHGDRSRTLEKKGCTDKWRNHLVEGRAAESVWEFVSLDKTNSTCGW
jgi:cytochrome c5